MEQVPGQMSFFANETPKTKRSEDMTNLELIKTMKADDLVRFIFNKSSFVCLQNSNEMLANEIWEINCRSGKYSGPDGCTRCRIDWLNSKVGEREKELQEQAKKRKEEMDRAKGREEE